MTRVPPVAAVYQVTPVCETRTVLASRVCTGLFSHSSIELAVIAGGGGAGVMVKTTGVLVVLEQVPLKYSA